MELQQYARIHRTLASETRLRIIRMLAERPMCVNAITRRLGISQPAVSQHLAVLSAAGLVSGEKQGYRVHYSIEERELERVKKALARLPYSAENSDAGEDSG